VAETQQDLCLPWNEEERPDAPSSNIFLFGLTEEEFKDIALDSSTLTKVSCAISEIVTIPHRNSGCAKNQPSRHA